MDVVAEEQKKIASQLARIEERLSSATTQWQRVDANLTKVLDLAVNGHVTYLPAEPLLRRLLNQAVFVRLYIDDRGVRAEFAQPFDVLLRPGTAQAIATEQKRTTSPAAVLGRLMTQDNERTPGALGATEGSRDDVRVSAFDNEGLKADTLAGLRDSLSNLNSPLLRVFELIDQPRLSNPKRRKYNTTKQVIAQTGAIDPSTVRLKVKENHKLSATEVERLVQANNAGMSQRKLAEEFDVSLETVNRHLRRRRQSLALGRAALSFRRIHSITRGSLAEEGGIAA